MESNNNINSKDSIESYTPAASTVFFAVLLRFKYFILIVTVLSISAAVYLALQLPDIYGSTLTAVPPKTNNASIQGAMGNLTSALKDIGLSKITGGADNNYSIKVIFESRSAKDTLISRFNLAKVYGLDESKIPRVREILEENLDVSISPEGGYLITVFDKDPKRAADMANEYLEIINNQALKMIHSEAFVNRNHLENRMRQTDSVLDEISQRLQSFSSKNQIFSPEDQAKSISTSLAEMKAEIIKQDILFEMMKNKYGEDDSNTQLQKKLVQKLREEFDNAQNEPGFAGNFSLKNASSIGTEYLRLYSEFQVFTKVQAFIMPLLEEARLDEARNTRALFVLDAAQPSDKKAKPKRSIIVFGAAIGSFVMSIFFVFLFYSIGNLRRELKILKKNI